MMPHPGLIRARDSGPECENLRRRCLGWTLVCLLGLQLRSKLHSKSLIISRTWLTLGGQFLQGQQGPRYQGIRNTVNTQLILTPAHIVNVCPPLLILHTLCPNRATLPYLPPLTIKLGSTFPSNIHGTMHVLCIGRESLP